jgi:aryl-alcohol dehydrogenase-like predicted oxidoreductase
LRIYPKTEQKTGLTWRAQPCSEEQAFEAMRQSLALGANFWNGGEFYGTPEYNSLTLLKKYFEKYPEDADKVSKKLPYLSLLFFLFFFL